MAPAKSVVITGASTGIGAACALHLDQLGWRVFAGCENRPTPISLDVTDTVSISTAASAVAGAVEAAGLAGLINNAGIVVPGPIEFLPLPDLRRQLEINVVGQVAVTQAFLPLIRAGRGRIVNMGSIAGRGCHANLAEVREERRLPCRRGARRRARAHGREAQDPLLGRPRDEDPGGEGCDERGVLSVR